MFTTTSIYSGLIHLIADKEIKYAKYGGVVEPWSLVPMLCLGFGLLFIIGSYFLGRFLSKKEKGEKYINLIVLIVGITFVILEIFMETSQVIEHGFYDFSSFPFQFCTMPMYMCCFVPFIKKESRKMPFIYFLVTFCVVSGIMPLVLGQKQLCRWQTIVQVIRSFAWHILMLANALLLIGFYHIGTDFKKEKIRFAQCVGVFLVITVIAELLNVGLHYFGGQFYPAPYNEELGMNVKSTDQMILADPDSASLMFISPFFRSNMVVFEDIWVTCGWFINYILYVIAFALGAFGILGLLFLNSFICNKIKLRIENSKLKKA